MKQILKRELRFGELLNAGFTVFRDNIETFLIIAAFVYVPMHLILGFFPVGDNLEGLMMYLNVARVLEGLFGTLASLAIIYAVKLRVIKKKIDYRKAYSYAFSRWWTALWTLLLMGLLLIGLYIMLIIPGLIMNVYWAFALPILALTDKYGWGVLEESMDIVEGRWWKVFGYSLGILIVSLFFGMFITVPFWFMPNNYLVNLVSSVLSEFVMVYGTIVTALFYVNLDKVRRKKTKEKLV